jgi:hypothetical protein
MNNITFANSNNNVTISRVDTARFNRFGKSGGAVLRSNTPLSDEQILRATPSVFAEAKHESRSIRNTYIPTREILTALRREGFQPYSVQQGGSKDIEKRAFTKHMIRLRHASALSVGVGATFSEIIIVNSHDGTTSLDMMGGMFKLACSNGLVVGQGLFDSVKARHVGDITQSVIEGCFQLLSRMPEVNESVAEMGALRLTAGEQQAYARAALVARYENPEEAPFAAEKLLTVNRSEDAAPTLWNTFNTVQENVINGGIRYVAPNKDGKRIRRSTREVNGIDQNVGVNRALWTLAEEMRKIKAQG